MTGALPDRRGLGVTAGLDAEVAARLAARCAELGYHSLWSNDEPDAPGLETLALFAAAAPALDLAVGVLPLHRYDPERIAAEVDRLGLDPARLWIGLGSGSLAPQLDALRDGVAGVRRLLPGARVVVAAMRPRLCRLGGAVADAVLLNWMPPAQAATARRRVAEGAAAEGRPAPLSASYVRVAVGDGAADRLRREEGRYRRINEGHRRHFEALGVPPGTVGGAAADREGVAAGLEPYRTALDLTIVRVLGGPDPASLLAVADAAAPGRPPAGP